MLKLNRNIRLLIAIIASVLILLFNIKFIVNGTINKIVDVKVKFSDNNKTIEDLSKLEKEKEERKKKEKFFKYQLEQITMKVPNNIVPETFITQLKNMVTYNGVEVEDILFTEPKIVNMDEIKTITADQELMQKANSAIEKLFKNDKKEASRVTDKVLQYTQIPDNSVIKVVVSFKISGEYEKIKKFIEYVELEDSRLIEDAKNKITIDKINLTGNQENSNIVEGEMSLNFYGIKDKNIPIYDLWNKDLNRGKLDFFSYEGSQRFDINDTNTSDFDIKLNPVTSDYPSVIVGKHGEYSAKIYGDNLGNEKVKIEIKGSNGNYLYKYNTQSISFPLNGGWKPFVPKTNKKFIVKIYSSPRLNNNDKAGMDLEIINKTDRNVDVITYNDDIKGRANYKIIK